MFTDSIDCLLESFDDPVHQLRIEFREVHREEDRLYMSAEVFEKPNNLILIRVDYELGGSEVNVTNIVSYRNDKSMNTSSGIQSGATDMGPRALKWLLKNITQDAQDRGYHGIKITSSTRYSGARAHNGPETDVVDIPVNYNVNLPLRERFVYTLEHGMVFLRD